MLNDAAVTSTLPRYELEGVAGPMLIISMVDDLFGTFDGARYSEEHIPRARLNLTICQVFESDSAFEEAKREPWRRHEWKS